MSDFLEEFTRPTWLSFPVIAARLLMAAVLGGVIGFEREWRNRPAGLRTHMLVCVAAGTVGILTLEIMHSPALGGREGAALDPLRAVEAVTAGVAFLAAGTIMFSRGEVQGLTTGASAASFFSAIPDGSEYISPSTATASSVPRTAICHSPNPAESPTAPASHSPAPVVSP